MKPRKNPLLFVLLLFCLLSFTPTSFATPTTPTIDFIDNGDGTVTHKLTGLVWMRCAMGQTWDKATANCLGTVQSYTWDEAMALKSSFAGKSDWRLPNIWELNTIVERENYNPAINTKIFPNTPIDLINYWSSTTIAFSNISAWIINFSGVATDDWDDKNSVYHVKLVRSGQPFNSLPLFTPTNDFIDNKDGTVIHKRTNLMWQRCAIGQTWTGSTCLGNPIAYDWNTAMTLTSNLSGHNDWRLPTANELNTIVEYGSYEPAINNSIFPNIIDRYTFLSSSLDRNGAIVIDSFYGYEGGFGSNIVRLVRGKWLLNLQPQITDVSPKTSVIGSPTVFTVTGKNLTDGMGFTVGDCEFSNNEWGKGTATKRQYLCTQYGAAGNKIGLVKNAPSGTTLYNFNVQAKTDSIPEIYAATDKKELINSNDTVSVLISTTVQSALNKSALYDLYVKFTLPDGSILYDDGISESLVSNKTPFSSKQTITQASDWSNLLSYSLDTNAPIGTYNINVELWLKNTKVPFSTSATFFDYNPPITGLTATKPAITQARSQQNNSVIIRQTTQYRPTAKNKTNNSFDPVKLISDYKQRCKMNPNSTTCLNLKK